MTGIAEKPGWCYTCFADDLTFSCSDEQANQVGYLLARLRHIAKDEGLALNDKKTRIQRHNTRQSVTGLVVNVRVGVPRKTVRNVRAILHRAQHEGLAVQIRENRPNFEAWVGGMIAYIEMANPNRGEALRQDYQRVVDRA